MEQQNNQQRANFSKVGILLAAAGSAVGLGNIWKFPYITGEYGGGAFLFVYLGFIIAIGLPVMLAELLIGRKSRRNAFGAFKRLAPKTMWFITGFLGVVAAYLILSFYGVVAGWSLHYSFEAVQGHLTNKTSSEFEKLFFDFIALPVMPILWQLLFMVLTSVIVLLGIKKGIERYSKILMPILLLILLILVVRSVTLPGAGKGLSFLFKPDFSKLSREGILNALGHAFFSLSLGMGTLITYGSYVRKQNNLGSTALQVTIADTVVALLAAMAIIPAVFAFDIAPGSGPGLVFITLPNVFQQMPGGIIFSTMFFILLSVAALTSSISILEVVVTFLVEEMNISRKLAVLFAGSTISVVGVFCSLSMGRFSSPIFLGLNFFDTLDFFAANVFLPYGGLLIALFIGWYYGKKRTLDEISNDGSIKIRYLNLLFVSLRFIAPFAIFLVSMYGIIEQIETYIGMSLIGYFKTIF